MEQLAAVDLRPVITAETPGAIAPARRGGP
jgi:hypothetical protein